MKNLNFKTVFTALLFVMCLSCSSDDSDAMDNNGNTINNSDTFLTAKIDGVDFEFTGDLLAINNTINGFNSIDITAGTDDNVRGIGIGLANIESTGTYTIIDLETDNPTTSSYIYSLSYIEGDEVWIGGVFSVDDTNGTVTITELSSDYIAGTFQFIVYRINSNGEQEEKNIKEGSFRIERITV